MYAQDNNSLPVWIILSPAHHHISINSQPFLVGIVSLLLCLLFDTMAPKDQPTYVPRKRHKRWNVLSTGMFQVLEQGASIIMERINNMKIKWRARPLQLRYSGYRPKCKKSKYTFCAPLTGMTTTWSGEQIATARFDSDTQSLMLDDGASACIMNDINDFIHTPPPPPQKGSTKWLRGSKVMLRPHTGAL